MKRTNNTRYKIGTFLFITLLCLSLFPVGSPIAAVYAAEPEAEPAVDPEADPDTEPEEENDRAMVRVLERVVGPESTNVTVRIEVAKDTFLSSRQPDSNFGGASILEIGWIADNYDAARIMIQFGVESIPQNATINSAELYIYQSAVTPPGDAPMTYRAQYVNVDWSEGSVTWNNANYLGGDSLPLGTIDNTFGWKTTDIKGLVQVWQSGSRPNHGLIITGDEIASNNRSRQFYSKERSGFQPYVIVNYDDTTSCDTLPPAISTVPLPQFSPSKYPVEWGGPDLAPSGCEPSGVNYYDVEYRINGQSWQRWKNQTTATRNTFKGWADNGDFVEFRARGTDFAGNVQDFGNPQTSTTVDTEPPVASMNTLPEFTVSPVFLISWSGTDNLSGIKYYDVQWRESGGNWLTLLEETTQTSFQVTGAENGKTYEFRARATDNVENHEEWGDEAQAQTTIATTPVSEVLPFTPSILKPTAPITTSFTVNWTGYFAPGTTISTYQIYYQYNNGPWQLWKTVPGTQNSDRFDYVALGLGDGVYGFESVATNNQGGRETQKSQPEASMIVDMADEIHPSAYMPLIAQDQPALR